MPNPHRGEVAATIAGRHLILCLTLGALAELEASETGLQSQIAINKQQLASLQALETQGAASRFQLLDYEKAIAQLESQRRQNLKQRVKLAAESSQKQAELAQQQAENRANRVATGEKLQRVVLRAPLTGTILNLKAKPAQVVAAGEVLLQLVPSDSLRAEAFMSNQDLAFVRPGQRADLSVASYDPNRYGTIGATDRFTSLADAVEAFGKEAAGGKA
jgi:multidrug resistance efflux pump